MTPSPARTAAFLAGLGSGLVLGMADWSASGLTRTPGSLILATLGAGATAGAVAGALGALCRSPRLAAGLVLAGGTALEGVSIASKELPEGQRLAGAVLAALLAVLALVCGARARPLHVLGALCSIPAGAWLGARWSAEPWLHLAGALAPLAWLGFVRVAERWPALVLAGWTVLLIGLFGADPAPPAAGQPPVTPRIAPPSGPSLVLLVIDTLRADEVPHDGALAAFARTGVEFRQCISAAPWTLPAVSSLLTGLYPSQHGAVSAAAPLPRDVSTLAELLHARGYATAAFTGGAFVSRAHGLDQGFERFDPTAERRFAPFGVHVPLVWRLAKNRYAPWRALVRAVDESVGLAGELAAARAWAESAPGRPKFLLLHTYQVHDYYLADPDVDDAVLASVPPLSARFAGRLSVHPRELAGASQADLDTFHALYRGRVAAVERLLPELVRALDERLGADTVWIVTADHGEGFDARLGRVHHGGRLHDDLLRVPLIVRAPGRLVPGRVVEEQVRSVDVLPTALELLGVERPEGLAGRSLLPALAGTEPYPAEAFAEERAHEYDLLALRAGGWKRITGPGREEAFRLADDALEERSLPRQAPPELRASMESFLARFPARAPGEVELDAATRAELRALGYD